MENLKIMSLDSIETINRAEIDMQITTARNYPRDLKKVLEKIEQYATLDTETAEDCFYALKRGKGNDAKVIEGLSVRFAEIIANCWGNIRVGTRILGNNGKNVTAQSICHDLETNVAISVEVERRITTKEGRTYSDDMIVVTGNAASAIAFRNAVLKVIPKAITKKIVENVKEVALGKALDLETSRSNCVANFAKVGVTIKQLCDYLEVKNMEAINKEHLFTLKGLWNAIKEGSTTVKETFEMKHGEISEIDVMKKQVSAMIQVCNSDNIKKQAIAALTKMEAENSLTIEKLEEWIKKLK